MFERLDGERYFFWTFFEDRTPQWRLSYDGSKDQINKYARQTEPEEIIRVSRGTVVLFEGAAKDYVKV